MVANEEAGPLLSSLLEAQERDREATSYPDIEGLALSLFRLVEDLGHPIVYPVGAPAERLAGATALLSRGKVEVAGWTRTLEGERVLLLMVNSVSPIPLSSAADQARRLGAVQVHATGVNVLGLHLGTVGDFDSYHRLVPASVDDHQAKEEVWVGDSMTTS